VSNNSCNVQSNYRDSGKDLIHVKRVFKALAKKRANGTGLNFQAAQQQAPQGKRNGNEGAGAERIAAFAVAFSPRGHGWRGKKFAVRRGKNAGDFSG
jgi:hypothetical protein